MFSTESFFLTFTVFLLPDNIQQTLCDLLGMIRLFTSSLKTKISKCIIYGPNHMPLTAKNDKILFIPTRHKFLKKISELILVSIFNVNSISSPQAYPKTRLQNL